MSIECGICERDLRSDHECNDPLCPRSRPGGPNVTREGCDAGVVASSCCGKPDGECVHRPAGDGTNGPAYEALLEIARNIVLRVDKWGAPFAVATEVDKLRPFVAHGALTGPEARK